MKWAEEATKADLLAELLVKPCRRCGAVDRFPSGECRPCARARVAGYELARPKGREELAQRVQAVLSLLPTTRSGLERALGASQQRISEALRDVGAVVVGRDKWAPIYALEERKAAPIGIGRVSSVWQLGSQS
jgi:hypothetical protein